MIKNERQYRITRAQAEKFERALSELRSGAESRSGLHPILRKAQEDALDSQLEDLQEQIRAYEDLRSGRIHDLPVESFDDLPDVLIQARIAAGLTQRELGARLGLAAQKIQQYEAGGYSSASFSRIQEVMAALGLRVSGSASLIAAGNVQEENPK